MNLGERDREIHSFERAKKRNSYSHEKKWAIIQSSMVRHSFNIKQDRIGWKRFSRTKRSSKLNTIKCSKRGENNNISRSTIYALAILHRLRESFQQVPRESFRTAMTVSLTLKEQDSDRKASSPSPSHTSHTFSPS